jgi:NAD(P)H dehydrogenase (quinone)
MIAVTGANGNLGRLVIKCLLERLPADQIIAAVRSPEKADDLLALGLTVREADYTRPETLRNAFYGAEKVLLISAVVPGQRLTQHKAVVDAAREAGVGQIAYTSMLRADTSDLILAEEHKATEEYIAASGLPFTFLRNAWYLENHTGGLASAIQHGAIAGCAGQGRFASASRADYAGAAVTVLTEPGHENKTYELAGDTSYNMSEFAAEVSKQVGHEIVYNNLASGEYRTALLGFGLPEMVVEVVVDADIKSSSGGLDSSSRDLQRLLGRPTTNFGEAIEAALKN